MESQEALIDALVRTSFATMAVLNRIAAEHDLSLTQVRVLAILRDRRATMSELADYLGLDKSTISTLVDRAAKRELLQRTPNPLDRRSVLVQRTPPGMAFLRELRGYLRDAASPKAARSRAA